MAFFPVIFEDWPLEVLPVLAAGTAGLRVWPRWSAAAMSLRMGKFPLVLSADFRAARSTLLFGVFEVEAAVAPPGHGGVGEVG